MKTNPKYKIAIIGSGKVATAIVENFRRVNIPIHEIWSRDFKNATLLSKKAKATAIKQISKLESNIFIFAIKDDMILNLAKKIPGKNSVILHTSGTVSLNILKPVTKNCGVIYPLQTFTGKNKVDFRDIPILTESSNKFTGKIISNLISKSAKKELKISSSQREKIHLAAVLVSNFPNFLYVLADKILKKEKTDFKILLPLITQVTENLVYNSPKNNQTGPALRKDRKTIQRHINLLKDQKEIQTIYKILSKSIINFNFDK